MKILLQIQIWPMIKVLDYDNYSNNNTADTKGITIP